MTQFEIVEKLRSNFGDKVGAWREMTGGGEYQRRMGSYLEIAAPSSLLDIAFYLRDETELEFNALLLISSLDNGDGTLSAVYHLESRKHGNHLALKVTVPAEAAHVPSVTSVWAHANWHEREAWDMMGIHFDGHPDHRRILLDEDWPGHPLRKDFEVPDFYHGMKVPY
jgi:NADH-quinone oxidoreductase subunit C